MTLAICFTNFGPYHLARLRALASALRGRGDRLVAYEVAGRERRYPWRRDEGPEPFDWVTLFPGRDLESIPPTLCRRAIRSALDRDEPSALGIVGYARPESMAMLSWARARGLPTVLMSESQEVDHPRAWWKESIKRRRVAAFSAGLVGGPSHARYLATLGMPPGRVTFGYNAVDNDAFARRAEAARRGGREGLPARPFFLAVSRFVPEKNLPRLVDAFARYRAGATGRPWDLVLCGGGVDEPQVRSAIRATRLGDAVHLPGFLQADGIARCMAHASAFVHPSLMEPWGLVVNEAAATGLPLLVSDRAGCVETLVPDPPGTTGRRLDPTSVDSIAAALVWASGLSERERLAAGRRAAEAVADWGPGRFAAGTLEALALAVDREMSRRRRASAVAGSGGARL